MRCLLPSLVGMPLRANVMVGAGEPRFPYGDEARSLRGNEGLVSVYPGCPIADWEMVGNLFHHTVYNELKITPEEHDFAFTERALTPQKTRESFVELILERFEALSVSLLLGERLLLPGGNGGIVVDCGHSCTTVAVLLPSASPNSLPVVHALWRVELGAALVVEKLIQLLAERRGLQLFSSADSDVALEMFRRLGAVAQRTGSGLVFPQANPDISAFELPDSQVVAFGPEFVEAVEVLFSPREHSIDCRSIPQVIVDAVASVANTTQRRQLWENVLFVGGLSLLPGFKERLKDEIERLSGTRIAPAHPIVAGNLTEKYGTWIGASNLFHGAALSEISVSSANVAEEGITRALRRCSLGTPVESTTNSAKFFHTGEAAQRAWRTLRADRLAKTKSQFVCEPENTQSYIPPSSVSAPRVSFFNSLHAHEEIPNLVVDFGSVWVRVGDCGNDSPSHVFGSGGVASGVVVDWDAYERTMKRAAGPRPRERGVVLAQPVLQDPREVDRITEIMFESVEVGALLPALDASLALYASGRNSALVVMCGAGVVSTAAIHNAALMPESISRCNKGSLSVSRRLQQVLAARGHQVSSEVARELAETHVTFAEPALERLIGLPGGESVQLSASELESCAAEIFRFLPDMVERAVKACPRDIQRDLKCNILVSGAMTQGIEFRQRLYGALSKRFPQQQIRVVASDKHSVWIGGSILGSLSTAQLDFVPRSLYEENGPEAVSHLRVLRSVRCPFNDGRFAAAFLSGE
eukprot:TRINITY_DN7608_c0_g1_i1.p1 TRINITY_DN7608_c0_g1~~TRINITY_DN7608_c0_g1_i1.p1  ORF type:complete len:778 (-),score=156.95 TRINITY_DN7608_c0_g1_i1:24-2288(-)